MSKNTEDIIIRKNLEGQEINDVDLEELAKLVKEGFTSGRLDSQLENGLSKHIAWELKMEVWVE